MNDIIRWVGSKKQLDTLLHPPERKSRIDEALEVAHTEYTIDTELRKLIKLKGQEYVRQFVASRPLPF